jgi:hypothetical protein
MSCEEVRVYLEGGQSVETPLVSRGLEEHIASCPKCAGFREEQEQLRASFDLMKEQAPSIPLSLDQKVLASYREHIRGLARARRPRRPARRFVLWALAGASAAAFALAIAYGEIAWFTRARHAHPTSPPTRVVSEVPSTGEAATRPRASATRTAGKTRRTRRFAAREREQGGPPAQPAADSGFLSMGGFRGLMYCDELSCAGAMDVIRVEVPAEALGVPLRASPGNEPVAADVLVGPDGVARGIRVVE